MSTVGSPSPYEILSPALMSHEATATNLHIPWVWYGVYDVHRDSSVTRLSLCSQETPFSSLRRVRRVLFSHGSVDANG